jgi:hypothetical protein
LQPLLAACQVKKLGICLVGGRVISDYSGFIAARQLEFDEPQQQRSFPMARIINFYVPASFRRTIRKPTGALGMAKIIPFPSAVRRDEFSLGRRERFGVRKILHNNGILSLLAGV